MCWISRIIPTLLICLAGCFSTTYEIGGGLARVIDPKQYDLQYPAVPDINPGELWDIQDGKLYTLYDDCPSAIHSPPRVQAGFNSVERSTFKVAKASVNLAPLARNIEEAKAQLKAAGITELTIDGEYQVRRVGATSQFEDALILAQCKPKYVKALGELKGRDAPHALVVETVSVRNLRYIAKSQDAVGAAAKLATSGAIAGGGFAAQENGTLEWKVPPGKDMVVAYKLRPVKFNIPAEALIAGERTRQAQLRNAIERSVIAAAETRVLLVVNQLRAPAVVAQWEPVNGESPPTCSPLAASPDGHTWSTVVTVPLRAPQEGDYDVLLSVLEAPTDVPNGPQRWVVKHSRNRTSQDFQFDITVWGKPTFQIQVQYLVFRKLPPPA